MTEFPKICPCGSGLAYAQCCEPVITHDSATTAEQLMRSRYSAFALGNAPYILKTWHPDTRPEDFTLGQARWLGLKIISTSEDCVSFEAAFHAGNKGMLLKETSRFVRIDRHWRYVDGDCQVTAIKRNAPCFCGSLKKYKNCCGKRGSNVIVQGTTAI